ncbi:hypothetical protein K438DRAFT_891805 [Mycena galopus ATCC 62051]|nr:hypothetical protein K438DRAFT_891805 [Mycena galopus ATCC 62051]
MSDLEPSTMSEGSCSTAHKPFVEPFFRAECSIDDARATLIDAFLMTHYMHTNFPSVLQDTLSPRDIKFRRTASQETVCVLVDLDEHEDPCNPDARPSLYGNIPFNAYDSMLAPRPGSKESADWDEDRDTLYSKFDAVNSAAPYKNYRHIFEAMFYILLWCISDDVPGQTRAWMERNRHNPRNPLIPLLKRQKEREAFMWDPTEVFAEIKPEFAPLVEAWLRPLWQLVSEAHFACRTLTGETRREKLESILTFDRIVEILRHGADGAFDLRIASLIPVPGDDSDLDD